MKYILLPILFFVLLGSSLIAQEIFFSKDSLIFNFSTVPSQYWSADSIIVKNIGNKNLLIDSIYSKNKYGYRLKVFLKDSIKYHNVYSPSDLLNIVLQPDDSVKFLFSNPDLCPICSPSIFKPFRDSIIIHSNSNYSLYSYLYSSGWGYTSVTNDIQINKNFSLKQNFPNPFNPITKIQYSIPKSGFVSIIIFDVLGKEIVTLVNDYKNIGNYEVEFNASKLASGIYFYTLSFGNYKQTNKMLLLR